MSRNPLIVAADVSDPAAADALARGLSGLIAFLKVGLELFVGAGPGAVERLRESVPIFLDLKLHDIPTTVEAAARNAARLGVGLLTVHALGGSEMIRAAVQGAATGGGGSGADGTRVIAVTVLSSLAGEGLASPASLAHEAMAAGAAGVVVSGRDVGEVREAVGRNALLVVPGIRPGGLPADDHSRVLSPAAALARGADYLVVGRPVTGSADPAAAAVAILREVGFIPS